MDAFALAKSKARTLRATIGKGLVSSFDVVRQALGNNGYEINAVDKNGVLLRGDDAQLNRDFSQVLVRDDVSDEQKALLAAHELGHLILHRPHDKCDLGDGDQGDKSRAVSRVETYGPRERRELQANVFAREFLLPRETARQLFLVENLTALEISKRIGMPLPQVRRQLLDAILLPDISVGNHDSGAGVIKLDSSQQKAVDFNGRALLVEAGPGSGKTRTLVARIERRLNDGVHPSRILALTFSNKAAGELSDRISARRPDDAVEVWTGTFHAFGLEVMRLHYEKLGLGANIRLLSPSQAVEMLEERLPLLGLRHFHDLRNPGSKLKEILKPIGRAKDELVSPPGFRKLAEDALASAQRSLSGAIGKARTSAEKAVLTAEKTLEAATVYEVYEALLREKKCIDFADLVMRATLLIESDEDVRRSFLERYDEILVDEYQDVNRACARLLKALHGPNVTLWVVGDSRQSIYRFRGASAVNMARFTSEFEDAESTPLEWNYRSSEHITQLSQRLADAMDRRQAHGGTPYTPRSAYRAAAKRGNVGSKTRVLVGLNDEIEADLVAAEINALQKEGVPFSQQTILARANGRLDELAEQLATRGIPTLHLGSFFEREEVRDLLSLLAMIAEPNGAALVRLATIEEFRALGSDASTVISHAREKDVALTEVLVGATTLAGVSKVGAANLARLGRSIAGMSLNMAAFDLVTEWLFERCDYLRRVAETPDIEGDLFRAAIYQLLEFLDQTDLDGKPLNAREILKRVRTVILMSDDRDLRDPGLGVGADAVRLMTVHAAKGLEFKATHIVGLHENGFPLQFRSPICQVPAGIEDGRDPRAAHAEEEDCAMFVAVSRAEDHLRLYHTEKAVVQARSPSRFLSDLALTSEKGLTRSQDANAPVNDGSRPIAIDTLTLFDISDFESCPLKIAYRHRLSIRSRRHEGPYLQASGVLYEVLDKVGTLADMPDADRDTLVEQIWSDRGPTKHSLGSEYRKLVDNSLSNLDRMLHGFRRAADSMVEIPISGGHVVLPAPLVSADGSVARYVDLRTVDPKKMRAGMLHAAARIAVGEDVAVEVAQLSSGDIVKVRRTPQEALSDRDQASNILKAVRSGALKPRREMRTCMRCAHFFSCPAEGAERD